MSKRKKAAKGYSYYEYIKKFRPKSLPEQEPQPSKEPHLNCLPRLVLDKIVPEGTETPAHSRDQK